MSAVGVGGLLPVSVAPSTANLSANESQAGGNELNVDFREDERRAVTSHKWRMVISYDGTRYSGWQYQSHPPTIQCVVEKALTKVTKLDRKELCLVGASRTDKGVHAWGQVAHFLTPFNYAALDDVHAALNGVLPDDIRVRELSPALPEFHARFSVESKIYHYMIYNDAVMDPFQRNYAFHSTYRLNPAAMKVAATHFVGTHDFSAFANVSRNDRVTNPVKSIYRCEVVEMGKALLQLEVEGSGFLYKQVRNMAALLYQIGKESIPPEIVPMILASRNRRELAKYTLDAPPHGLTLISVKYNKEHLQLPVDCSPVSFGRPESNSYKSSISLRKTVNLVEVVCTWNTMSYSLIKYKPSGVHESSDGEEVMLLDHRIQCPINASAMKSSNPIASAASALAPKINLCLNEITLR